MPGRAGGAAPGGRTGTHTESTLYLRRTCTRRRMTQIGHNPSSPYDRTESPLLVGIPARFFPRAFAPKYCQNRSQFTRLSGFPLRAPTETEAARLSMAV